ncbi:flagellar basal-body MS-ring/collar protein FliF [Halomonas sp. HP20-15]|uniref:flagellar basal-body MS-ring/collar protein FliF n=1 Tax=Halomonas sp. HP20-15 TaxID=3085901 RepID=UPI0029825832|nr:flagellar basal-body MS-ring/collar protein FliF [Halomonas sp. HP20-15]MDW5375708.1 flagellar basal-body MS-ring/collar protein FliF [Halomonas sp. HP20-15]
MSDVASSQQSNARENHGRAANASAQGSSAQGLLTQLRTNPRIPLIIAAAAAIALIAVLLLWARSPEYRVLYSNLSNADGGSIINELDARGIPYQFSEGGGALLVPADQVHTLRLQLAEQGLPKGGDVGFELMDNQAFGISQFAEQINFQRSLEGELAQSMKALGPVAQARVHLSMAKPSVFVRESEPAKASVVLTLEPGRVLGEGQVNAIVHMVSSSVPQLATEAVTVVDQNGRLLSRNGSQLGGLDGTQLSYVQEIEKTYQKNIERILAPILGADNVRAQVAAQVDFSKREQTAERYSPNQAPNEAAVRSRQVSESYTGGDVAPSGIPGALSNTPPGTAASPIDNGAAKQGDNADAADGGENDAQATDKANTPPSRLDRNDTVNYEVDHHVEHVQFERGGVERLSVAVVVDYREGLNEAGETVKQPLSDEQLAQIERLVRQAMGFSQARGDAIEVVNSPFTESDETIVEVPWWQTPGVLQLAMTLGRYLLVALAALFLWFMVLRPLIKRQSAALPANQSAALRSPTAVSVGGNEDYDDSDALSEAAEAPPRRRRRANAYEQNLKDAREIAQEDPRLVAMIVRSWMNDK